MDDVAGNIEKPSYPELVLVILTGVFHVMLEILFRDTQSGSRSVGRPGQVYNGAAAVLWGVYVLWRAVTTPGLARVWGFRWDNFLVAARLCLAVALPAAAALLIYGAIMGRLPVPQTFWMVLVQHGPCPRTARSQTIGVLSVIEML